MQKKRQRFHCSSADLSGYLTLQMCVKQTRVVKYRSMTKDCILYLIILLLITKCLELLNESAMCSLKLKFPLPMFNCHVAVATTDFSSFLSFNPWSILKFVNIYLVHTFIIPSLQSERSCPLRINN